MMCILKFIQDEITNLVGVFQSHDHAVEFLKSIPFLTETTDEYGIEYRIKYKDMPDGYTVTYNGWRYMLSRFSYSARESAEDIEAILIDVCNLGESPTENGAYVKGYTDVDGYSCDNSKVLEAIEKREAFYSAAKQYYETQGRKTARDGLGSQDGEYVMVSDPGKPLEMYLSFLLDPQTIDAWEKAGSFEAWLSQNQTH